MFLADPQGWKKPPAHPQATELREGPLTVVVHAPYVVNLASRALTAASPSTLLVDRATRDALPQTSFACGDENISEPKGFDRRVSLYEVTRTG